MDVFFYEAFAEEAAALRAALPAGVQAGYAWEAIHERRDAAPPARLISVRTQSVIPPEWSGQLAGILTRSTGYDHLVAYREAVEQPPQCGYLPLYCARAVAEQALLLWTALLRKLPLQQRQFRSFQRDGLTGRELAGRTLAVFGVGNIGYEVVRLGQALGMQVVGVDIVERHADVHYVAPEAACRDADVIVAAMNLTAENRGYFDAGRLAHCRAGCIFVNVARGELSPVPVLAAGLAAGRLGGVGLDVYEDEPALAAALRRGEAPAGAMGAAIAALAARDDVILTPHNAFNTHESVQRKSEQSARQIEHFMAHGTFIWPVPAGAAAGGE